MTTGPFSPSSGSSPAAASDPRGARGRDRGPGILIRPPVIYAAVLLAALGLEEVLPLFPLPPFLGGLGYGLIAAALGLMAWCLLIFRRAGTQVDTAAPASRLVTGGPFKFSRNPIYISLTLIYLGIVLAAGLAWALLLLPPLLVIIQTAVVRREERYLERRFGEAYRNYCQATRRWL